MSNELNSPVSAQTSIQVGLRDLANVFVQDQLREHKRRLMLLKDKYAEIKDEISERGKELRELMNARIELIRAQAEEELRGRLDRLLAEPEAVEVDVIGTVAAPSGIVEDAEYKADISLTYRSPKDDTIEVAGNIRLRRIHKVGQPEYLKQEEINRLRLDLEATAIQVAQQQDFLSTQHEWLPEAEAQLTKAVAKSNGISDKLLSDLGQGLTLLGADRLPSIDG